MHDHETLVSGGLARWYRGRLIPVMKGGDGTDEVEPLFAEVPEDLATLDDAALAALVEDYEASIAEITSSPASFVSTEMSAADLIEATKAAIETLKALKAETASRVATVELSPEDAAAFEALGAEETEPVEEPAEPAEPADAEAAAAAAAAAAETEAAEAAAAAAAAAAKPLTAAVRGRLPRPTPEREVLEHRPEQREVALVAAGGAHNMLPGTKFGSQLEIAEAMVERHRQFGQTGPGTVERYAIAKANWQDEYPVERQLRGLDEVSNLSLIDPVISPAAIKRAMRDRIHEAAKDPGALVASGAPDEFGFVASGGLCAPVTPYYNLQYISVPVRPVMGSLPSFMADRGGLRYARPAALSAVTTAVGIITEAEDAAGGTAGTKTCQVIPCPEFQETDVDTIYHCLQFGNLGARAFPELVAQWNNLTLAAHARLAESNLLTLIDAFSTQVTAGALGLGASATLFSQILAAANGLRNRNRMDPNAVLRLMMPWWGVDLIVSDVIRSQFQRFDTDQARVTALLRSLNIEPTFYIDGANGRGQVFDVQGDGALLPFPDDIVWYLFPEGSFIYLDSGMLELGIVRDSVLNITNDFQLFGETFESVAFVGVEALAVETEICDSGTVSLPHAVTCPIDYSLGS